MVVILESGQQRKKIKLFRGVEDPEKCDQYGQRIFLKNSNFFVKRGVCTSFLSKVRFYG